MSTEPPRDPERKSFQERMGFNFSNYSQPHPRDLIAYILLILGLILLFIVPIYGGLIIGLVAGVYFAKELTWYTVNYQKVIEEQGVVKSLILAGILLAFFVSAPAIFVGIAIVVLIRLFMFNDKAS